MIKKFKKIYRVLNKVFKVKRIIYSIFSIIGAFLVYIFAFIKFIFTFKKGPLEKIYGNILLIATGPSLSKLNQEIIDNHDFIFFLNSAFQIQKYFNFAGKKKYLIIWDSRRLDTILNNQENIKMIKDMTFIINPMNFHRLDIYIKSIFLTKCKKEYIFPKPIFITPFSRKNKQIIRTFVTHSLINKNDVLNPKIEFLNTIPIAPHTVALNAFYYLLTIKHKLDKLTFVGCDFKLINSSNLISSQSVWASSFKPHKILLWFRKLENVAKANNITVDRII